MKEQYGDVSVTILDGYVGQVEIQRGPNNFFDHKLIKDLADCFEDIDDNPQVRAIVLCSEGKHFCAGANYGSSARAEQQEQRSADKPNPLYTQAVRLFRSKTPIVAAIQGAAVGGGFGLAVMADFRVICPNTRMTANFVKLGFTPGFGLTHTLPRVIGTQNANLMFYTGRRINGETAQEWGLGDIYTDNDNVREAAIELAREIAENAPLAVVSVREQMRPDLADAVKAATDIENAEQFRLQKTADHKEGVKAVSERRPGNFSGT
ncbi:MAG: enoyl-CoA hydratase/isomerase family protein [Gammaproteobacteria bacterium]|nr:enoyl-CoA hydratase/isomerase family protein [Gammaproteobacteria bacterium]